MSINAYREPIEAYPSSQININVEIRSKGLSYTLDGSNVKTVTDFFIGPNYERTYITYLKTNGTYDEDELNDLTYNSSFTNLRIIDREDIAHTLDGDFDDVFDDFLYYYEDDIEDDIETYMNSKADNELNRTSDFMINVTQKYFEEYQSQTTDFSFETYDTTDSDTWPDFYGGTFTEACLQDHVFIEYDPWNNPYSTKSFLKDDDLWRWAYYGILTMFAGPHCKGFVLYDFNDDCHNMIMTHMMGRSMIFINGTVGNDIMDNMNSNSRISFWADQYYNSDVESYNVIGTIYGEDQSQTVIVSSLYDSWWNNGTTDSAIGVGILMSIAKYFTDNKIVPEYNLKFIGFAGEERGLIGSDNYAARHKQTDGIIAVIDLNQLGFTERNEDANDLLEFVVTINKHHSFSKVDEICEGCHYEINGDENAVFKVQTDEEGANSNDRSFAGIGCDTVNFLKDTGWTLHHRNGRQEGDDLYTEGDTLEYYNPDYIPVISEMVLHTTLYYTIDSDPGLGFSPSSLPFGSIAVDKTVTDTFEIWNSGEGLMEYTLDTSQSWLSVFPDNGTSFGEHDTITVTVNSTGLSTGYKTGNVIITWDDGTSYLPVSVTICPEGLMELSIRLMCIFLVWLFVNMGLIRLLFRRVLIWIGMMMTLSIRLMCIFLVCG